MELTPAHKEEIKFFFFKRWPLVYHSVAAVLGLMLWTQHFAYNTGVTWPAKKALSIYTLLSGPLSVVLFFVPQPLSLGVDPAFVALFYGVLISFLVALRDLKKTDISPHEADMKKGRARFLTAIPISIALSYFGWKAEIPTEGTLDSGIRSALGILRESVGLYQFDAQGKFPARLEILASGEKYIHSVPDILPVGAGHRRSNAVKIFPPPREGEAEPYCRLSTDDGGWGYIPKTGEVFINCTHKDSRGVRWCEKKQSEEKG